MATLRSFRSYASLAAAGLAVGAVGVVVQAASGADLPGPVPPGALILAAAAVLTLVLRWRWTPVGSALVALLALLNVVGSRGLDPLLGGEGAGVAVGKWMLLLGALTALIAGVLALITTDARRRTRETTGPRTDPRSAPAEPIWARRAQIAGLLVLAPVCAEYLAAYDDSTGDALRLVGGLVVFSPLYGAPALLIREVSRRAGLGWLGIILLAAAFGLTEAGLVDQSLFSLDYRHIESWDETTRGTFVHPLGLSAYNALNFVGGHVIYSICAPIALVEAFRPDRQREPWLGRWGLAIVATLYIAASVLVLNDSLTHESSHASTDQLVGSVVVVLLLVAGAFILGRRRLAASERRAPRVLTVFLLALLVALVDTMVPPTWTGLTLAVSALVIGALLLSWVARSPEWNVRDIMAIAVAAVLTRAVLAFTYFPVIGEVSAVRKYGHNGVLLVAVLVISVLAWRAAAGHSSEAPAQVAASASEAPRPTVPGADPPARRPAS